MHFPGVVDPPLPLPIPLGEFEGTYFHPGYGNVTLAIEKPADDLPVAKGVKEVLHAELRRDFDFHFDLEHVSGLHFIAYLNAKVRTPMLLSGTPAGFEVGPDGKVVRVGARIEPAMEEKMWFDKIL
jgi:hypothetical protein